MHALSFISASILTLFLAWCTPLVTANYWITQQPAAGVQWANGQANAVQWVKGVNDGIVMVDVEMSRLSQDGLIFVARNVPTKPGALNIFLQDIPAADDYYLLFLNSTIGVMYGTSHRFSVGDTANSSATTIPAAPTVTVSGAPNPTAVFATTFPALANGVAVPGWRAVQSTMPQMVALLSVTMLCLLGGAWTVL